MADAKATAPKADKPAESKRDKFVRLAEARVVGVIGALAKVEALANKGQYEYTNADVTRIDDAVRAALTKATSALNSGHVKTGEFSLVAPGGDE
jgi:hypothetical protein